MGVLTRSLLALAVVLALGAAACGANIADGSVACGPGGACPPGFTCGADGKCWKHLPPPVDAQADVTPPRDAGPEAASGDAAPDALPDAASPPVRYGPEVISGAGRLKGGTLTLDVEVGHGVLPGRAQAGGRRLEGAAVVKQ